jgi:ubiquinone/menaquinone biosynthesis C-methylase UbiE
VVGVDLTPELLAAGRRVAAEAGVEVNWVEGDAEALPLNDASFDVVVSVFGCMFAPRHEVAADELHGRCGPGAAHLG